MTGWEVNDDSLVCQPWSDTGRRAIPLVGDKNFVDKFGAKVNASTCEVFGDTWRRTSFRSEGGNVWWDEGWGGTTSGRGGSHARGRD